ncbi:MAG TPA: sugar phosphate isomerase/epimerase family protein [Abditibacteriaceae bacterium]|jgi:sugar phosphate isomerase/epimerase
MKFGICCGPGSFAPQVEGQALSALPRLMEGMQEAGADYVEFGVSAVMGSEEEFAQLQEALSQFPLNVEAYNSFIPAKHRITGPDVNLEEVIAYCHTALTRCKALGGEVVVLGSGAARRVVEGFDREKALQQFVEFGRALGPVAEEVGIDIAIEPLNKNEDNLINTVRHGAQLVDEIAQPRIQLLADLYHMFTDGESLFSVTAAGARLRHTHVCDLGRVPPGFASGGEANFKGFFRALKAVGYNGRCSFEGSSHDLAAQSKPMLDFLKQRFAES